MKPLTIEQLKELPVGEWVWIVDKNDKSYYAEIAAHCEEVFAIATYLTISTHFYSEYGKTWLAYKNKEEAEENIQLKKGDTLYYATCVRPDIYEYTVVDISRDSIAVKDPRIPIIETYPKSALGSLLFTSYIEAERCLKELKGE